MGLEDSEREWKKIDISELILEKEVMLRNKLCLKKLDQNTINRSSERKERVVKASIGKWKKVVRSKGKR